VPTRVTFLLVLAAVVAGCGSHHAKAPPPAPPLVRWANIVTPALRVPHGAAATPCSAADLKVVGQGFVFQSAPAGAVGAVVLRNAAHAPCRLTGRPHVRFVGTTATGAARDRASRASRRSASTRATTRTTTRSST
jgi:hypothetical protein